MAYNNYGTGNYSAGWSQQGSTPQPVQQVQPGTQLSSIETLLGGNSAKSFFNANSQPGATVTGVIEKIDVAQVNNFQTKQPDYWPDGKPKEQFHIIIQTTLRDPSIEDDDGRRSLWVKGWGEQRKALLHACQKAGVKAPKTGDTITMTYKGLGQQGNAPQPPKIYEFTLQPAAAAKVETMLNAGATPASASMPGQPGVQAGYGTAQPTPQPAYQPTVIGGMPAAQANREQAGQIHALAAQGMTPTDIATQLGLPASTVQNELDGEPDF
ncbi:helix-turn-helix domain-containing protein [Bifidobacterium tissieri]|uniref:helix-turn-helix domain-containing protein n=1 Tax=Bifidobacterium tissieri TaxID=1630162 RepID=UPI0012395E8B|nr:helix-turn-helix domain-containing protein [Bifidobacterium tissieri]KAA8832590.1 helix-turn-helix domain-containing protein [Bifidobacterium tissieri]